MGKKYTKAGIVLALDKGFSMRESIKPTLEFVKLLVGYMPQPR